MSETERRRDDVTRERITTDGPEAPHDVYDDPDIPHPMFYILFDMYCIVLYCTIQGVENEETQNSLGGGLFVRSRPCKALTPRGEKRPDQPPLPVAD